MLSKSPIPLCDIPSALADSPFIFNELVAPDSLLRRIAGEVDFSFAREAVERLYCLDNGKSGIAPEMLCRVTFLQFLYNLSDREVIEACRQRIDFKFFLRLAIESPAPCDASTLSRIRTRWGEETFKSFFEITVEQARAKNLLGGKRVVDSSKTLMNAAVLRSSELLNRLCTRLLKALQSVRQEGDEALERLETQAAELKEDSSWLLSSELKEKRYMRWGEHADELLSYVLALLARTDTDDTAKARAIKEVRGLAALLSKHLGDAALEEQLKTQAENKVKGGPRTAKPMRRDKMVSDVDPQARQAADHKRRVKAGYKTHVSMDSGSEIVTAVIVTPMNCDDGPVLPKLMADELRRGLALEEVAADAAYADGPVREALAKADSPITAYIPEPAPKPSSEDKYISSDFAYNPEAKTLTCPADRVSSKVKVKGESLLFYFIGAVCASCPLKDVCLSNKETASGSGRGRTVSVSRFRPLHEAARAAQGSDEYKDAMNRRLAVEHKQAEMLNRRGLRYARYRGLSKAAVQAYLTAAATNIRRMAVLGLKEEKNKKMATGAA